MFCSSTTRILFVTGKGGVGKSAISAAIAQNQIQKGRSVLLVELGLTSFFKEFFGIPQTVGLAPVRLSQGYDLALWDGYEVLKEYVGYLVGFQSLADLFMSNRLMQSLINIAPGLTELSLTGKATSGVHGHGPRFDYDLVIVDCYSTGHALALFRAPQGMQSAIQRGPMGQQSREINNVLTDTLICEYVVVTQPEELPVVEASELCRTLNKELKVEPSIVLNRYINFPGATETETVKTPPMNFFYDYVQGAKARQDLALGYLKKMPFTIYLAPFVFDIEASAIVNGLADGITAL